MDSRRRLTLSGLSALAAVVVLLLGILIPQIERARESARRSQCENKLAAIGLGLQNHHDVFKRFPAVTNTGGVGQSAGIWQTAPGAVVMPGQPAPNGYNVPNGGAAGYSWIVKILSYLGEDGYYPLYNISNGTSKFTYEAFSPVDSPGAQMSTYVETTRIHFATVPVDDFVCPSYGGSKISTASSGTAKPAVAIPAYAALYSPSHPGGPIGVAITNYVALPATHLACLALGPDDAGDDAAEPPNGVIVPGPRPTRLSDISDGAATTFMVCETKEPAVNSWYDGTVCWTVGANPSASQQPTRSKTAVGLDGKTNLAGEWVFPQGTTNPCGLNYGPGTKSRALFAHNGTTPAQTQPVSWGPSSDHLGGVVMHLTADGAAHAISPGIDPQLYLRLITRAGTATVQLPAAAP